MFDLRLNQTERASERHAQLRSQIGRYWIKCSPAKGELHRSEMATYAGMYSISDIPHSTQLQSLAGRGSIPKAAWRLSAEADVHCFDWERLGLGRGLPLPPWAPSVRFSPLERLLLCSVWRTVRQHRMTELGWIDTIKDRARTCRRGRALR